MRTERNTGTQYRVKTRFIYPNGQFSPVGTVLEFRKDLDNCYFDVSALAQLRSEKDEYVKTFIGNFGLASQFVEGNTEFFEKYTPATPVKRGWFPKKGSVYYSISVGLVNIVTKEVNIESEHDLKNFNEGNYFKTIEEAQKACLLVRSFLK